MSKEIDREWIRQCLFEFVGERLDGMDDYFHRCWIEAGMARSGVPSFKNWFEGCRVDGSVCDMIGEWWYRSFRGKEKEFKEFMERIDFSGYIDRFKEDFEVNIVWVNHRGGPYWLRDKLDIEVNML